MSLNLLHSPAYVAREVLIAKGAVGGLGEAWPAYVTGEPPTPDSVVTLYNTSPRADGRSQVDGENWQHYGLQVRVRGEDPATAYAKAAALERAMMESVYDEAVVLDGVRYVLHCFARTQLTELGKDTPGSKRNIVTVNTTVTLRRDV